MVLNFLTTTIHSYTLLHLQRMIHLIHLKYYLRITTLCTNETLSVSNTLYPIELLPCANTFQSSKQLWYLNTLIWIEIL